MKILSFIITCISLCSNINAQNTDLLQNDLNTIASHSGNLNLSGATPFYDKNVKGNRYLFSDWTSGSVTLNNNEVYSNDYIFNFDKLTQDLYAKAVRTGITLQLDKLTIKEFKLENKNFVGAASIKAKNKNLFYEELIYNGAKFSLFKSIETKFIRSNPNDFNNAREGNLSDAYIDEIKYYISNANGELKQVSLYQKNIEKALKPQIEKVGKYFTSNSSKIIDESLLIGLIYSLNE